ncbi:HNH endonuclease [Streptomyces scabiei]|uniref:HNH endonuclease n=1 Tax=Streptomyces scabiei TaxID=1930 RepID=UPI0029A27FA2|nr:HNH endonuclease [Streptomyces scabiei]MDX2800114.1 HNH endonuclease [Streptomyces scabiei]MDX3125383.1 HNH endonuclease [Streptomyces scabiei]MDX3282996.1 HNH endonuclease [Streptomyces scabiei]
MTINLQNWVPFDRALARDGSVDPTDKAVYAAIASFVDPVTGRSPSVSVDIGSYELPDDVPTRKRLAECIGKTIFTVDRSIKRLEGLGVLRVHRQVHPDNPKVHVPSVYELFPHKPKVVPAATVVVPGPRKRLGISATKRARIMSRDGNRCQKCGATDDLTIDHIQHWSRGGTNADSNLRVLCRSCNSQRSDGVLEGLDS